MFISNKKSIPLYQNHMSNEDLNISAVRKTSNDSSKDKDLEDLHKELNNYGKLVTSNRKLLKNLTDKNGSKIKEMMKHNQMAKSRERRIVDDAKAEDSLDEGFWNSRASSRQSPVKLRDIDNKLWVLSESKLMHNIPAKIPMKANKSKLNNSSNKIIDIGADIGREITSFSQLYKPQLLMARLKNPLAMLESLIEKEKNINKDNKEIIEYRRDVSDELRGKLRVNRNQDKLEKLKLKYLPMISEKSHPRRINKLPIQNFEGSRIGSRKISLSPDNLKLPQIFAKPVYKLRNNSPNATQPLY